MTDISSAKAEHISFVQKLYSTIDKMDADGFGKFFAADGTFTLGRFPTNMGPDQASLGASYAFSSLNAIQHEITSVWSTSDDKFTTEGKVTYTFKNGKVLDPIDFGGFFEVDSSSGLITRYRAYIDLDSYMSAAAAMAAEN